MDAEVLKVEAESESCCVCGTTNEDLWSPEEHDASSPTGTPPLRAVLLHLNSTKIIPSGRFCGGCINRALEAYSFSTMLAAKGPPPLSEKIRALRRRLHELTQKIDVFIVVGGGANGAYSEEDIIMVERDALAAASLADEAEAMKAQNMKGENVYQCTVCPLTFQSVSEYRAHAGGHGRSALHSCWECGAQFPSAAAAREHARDHRPSVPAQAAAHPAPHPPPRAPHFVCGHDGCILRFNNRNNLLSHIRKCHAEPDHSEDATSLRCVSCDRLFASAAALKRHARVHKTDQPSVTLQQFDNMEWDGSELDGKVEYLEVETLEELDDQL